MSCTDYGIVPIIKGLKATFLMLQVITPILAIAAFTILLLKMMYNPDDKKLINNLKNSVFALVILFLIPTFVNLTMVIMGEKFDISSCWNNAYKIDTSSKGSYIENKYKTNTKNKVKILEEKKYDKGGSGFNNSSSNLSDDTNLTIEGSNARERWLNALTEVGKYMSKHNFVYSNSDNRRTLAEATKNRRTNCAHYVSMAMQEAGIMPKGKTIWLNNKINGNGASYIKNTKKVTVYYPNKGINNLNLQPGDIVGWKSSGGQHTTVYAGKSKGGKLLWYSGGSGDVNSKNFGPKTKGYGNRTVHVVIRPNYNML